VRCTLGAFVSLVTRLEVKAMITQMTNETARQLLAAERIGRLGCVYEDGPYVVPVNYVLDGESIYVHSLAGRKLEALRANPKACLQVDRIENTYEWRSAIAFGVFEELTESGEREAASRLLLTRFPNLTPVESVPVHDGQSSVVLFRLRITEVTGVEERAASGFVSGRPRDIA